MEAFQHRVVAWVLEELARFADRDNAIRDPGSSTRVWLPPVLDVYLLFIGRLGLYAMMITLTLPFKNLRKLMSVLCPLDWRGRDWPVAVKPSARD